MGRYRVRARQNLYDIALHIYGSIEGIVDLMMNNVDLSLCDKLKPGDELLFTDDFVINNDVVSFYRMNKLIPSNGERTVYFKTASYPMLFECVLNPEITTVEFTVAGNGVLEIDWGDNSGLQTLHLSGEPQTKVHFFDNRVATSRKIRFYGDAELTLLDLTGLIPDGVFVLKPIYIERFCLNGTKAGIDFINLFEGTFRIEMKNRSSGSLLSLLSCKKLKRLDLSGGRFDQPVIDEYLICLVKKHEGRRNCEITLSVPPSGEYRCPERDDEGNYQINSGMEAVWLLVNEPAWNEAGEWKFTINGDVYCKS